MSARHKQALAIQSGACNPSGIAITIAAACREVREEGGWPASDPAVRLMVHQLAFVCGISEIDSGSSTHVYARLTDTCEQLSK